MNNVLLLGMVFFFNYVGMSYLALSLKSHWQQLQSLKKLSQQRVIVYRIVGSVFIFAALIFCFRADQPSIAILVWVMSATVTAKAVAFTLSYRANWLKPLSHI
jgi:uncharacterized membrane protein